MGLHVGLVCCALMILANFVFSELPSPKSPCYDEYDYAFDAGITYGVIRLQNDNSGVYKIEVNMTLPIETNETIYLSQIIPTYKIRNGHRLMYRVDFPFNHTFPALTGIRFNGKMYCNSTSEDAVTHLSRSHVIDTAILDLINATLPDKPSKINKYPDVCGLTIEDATFSTKKKTVANGEYPWLVALFVFKNGKYDFRCGGNLISDKHVLTAAHCVKSLDRVLTSKKDLLVVLGTTDIRNWAVNGISRGVERCTPHKDYVTPAVSDIALLTLDKPVDFNNNIRPVCIWDDLIEQELLQDVTGIVAGWGLDEERKVFTNDARQVKAWAIFTGLCVDTDERYRWLTSSKTFCAGSSYSVNPCTGDSGSGFVIKRKGRWSLRGIVSTGLKDNNTNICETKLYTVFVDVGKYRKWLIEELKQEVQDEIHTDS